MQEFQRKAAKVKEISLLFFAFLCSAIIVYSSSNLPVLEREIVNKIILEERCRSLIIRFACMYILRAAFKLIRNHTCAYTGNTIVNRLREQTLQNLLHQVDRDVATYEYSVLTNDLPIVAELLSSQTFVFLENILILIIAIYRIWDVSIGIGCIFIVGLSLLLCSSILFECRLQPVMSGIKDRILEITSNVEESIISAKTIWAFDLQNMRKDSFEQCTEGLAMQQNKQVELDSFWKSTIDFLSQAVFVTAIAASAISVICYGKDAGLLIMVNSYSKTLTNVTIKLGEFIRFAVDSKVSMLRYKSLVRYVKEERHSKTASRVAPPEKICFTAPLLSKNGNVILKDICLELQRNELVVVLGKSGEGKTILADAMAGLLENNGAFYFDGQKIEDTICCRDLIGYCQQRSYFFTASIEDNIRLWSDCGNLKKVEKLCALDFIDDLPDKYQTIINSDAPFMSGGEGQRLALARTIMREPYVLLLDDCLDAIDQVRRKAILSGLKAFQKDKITILFTSDRTFCEYADKVYQITARTLERIS